jgi:hypothetical protein
MSMLTPSTPRLQVRERASREDLSVICCDASDLGSCSPPAAVGVEALDSSILQEGDVTPWPTVELSPVPHWRQSGSEFRSLGESMLDAVLSLLVQRILAEHIAAASSEKDQR